MLLHHSSSPLRPSCFLVTHHLSGFSNISFSLKLVDTHKDAPLPTLRFFLDVASISKQK